MARLLTGREAASALTEELKGRTALLARQGVTPKLVILRCGEDEADGAYLRGALKRGALCGVEVEVRTLPDTAAAAGRHRCCQRRQHRPRMFAAAAPAAPSAGRGAGDL